MGLPARAGTVVAPMSRELDAVCAALERAKRDDTFAAFASGCAAMRDALTPAAVKAIVEQQLSRIATHELGYDPWTRPSYVVAKSGEYDVDLTRIEGAPTKPRPMVQARHSAIGVIAGGPVRIRTFAWTRASRQTGLRETNGTVCGPSYRTLSPGEWFAAEQMATGYDVADASTPALCFRMQGPIQGPFHLRLDEHARAVDGVINAVGSVSRIESAVGVLARIAPEVVPEIYDELCDHPVHTVRWLAAQVATTVDRSSLPRVLARLASDEHPVIRSSARMHLDELIQGDRDGRSA